MVQEARKPSCGGRGRNVAEVHQTNDCVYVPVLAVDPVNASEL